MRKAKPTFNYEWPRPALTVDAVLFTVAGTYPGMRLRVLLIHRGEEPHRGSWALPGGFVRENEDLPAAAARELAEEAGIRDVYLEQVGAVGTPGRDPRGHTVTVVYMGLVAGDRHRLAASGDAQAAAWFDVADLGEVSHLAFDHAALLRQALGHLRRRVTESPLVFELLPREFTLSELQNLYEAILDRELDRRNFRRKVEELKFLVPVHATRRGAHRPAQLYRFDPAAFAAHVAPPGQLPF